MVIEEGTPPPPKAMETDEKLLKKPVHQPRFEKYVVPMSLHAENRAKLVKALGETLSAAGKEKAGVVLLQVSRLGRPMWSGFKKHVLIQKSISAKKQRQLRPIKGEWDF